MEIPPVNEASDEHPLRHQTLPLYKRVMKAAQWFAAAFITFWLIGIGGADNINERQQWPQHQAKIVNTTMSWTHALNEYEPHISLLVNVDNSKPYMASLAQRGPR